MTRNEIEMEYRVEHGCIVSIGKFEHEPIYAPYFWEASCNGEANDNLNDEETICEYIEVQLEDIQQFPELKDVEAVTVTTDTTGFVYVKPTTLNRWNEIKTEESSRGL